MYLALCLHLQRAATSSYWQGDEDTNGPDGQTGPPEAPGQNGVLLHQRPPRTNTDGQELQQEALQLGILNELMLYLFFFKEN